MFINESVTVMGISFFFSAYSRQFGHWAYMAEEDVLFELYKSIPKETQILVTHTPPFSILDNTIDGIAAGSKSLLNKLGGLPDLQYNIFGHIHEKGATRLKRDGVEYINCSILNERYEFANLPQIFYFK
jgi:Icc-related predicted phosphoesterase